MAAIATRVDALIARALDAAASVEEQRTSAHIAVRLIRQHGLLDASPEVRPVYEPKRAVIRTKFESLCRDCGKTINEGDRCAWSRGAGAVCLGCHRDAYARSAA